MEHNFFGVELLLNVKVMAVTPPECPKSSVEFSPIEESIDEETEFKSVERRYYERLYFRNPKNDNGCNDQVILVHSNRICLICIAPEHEIVTGNCDIEKIDFSSKKKNSTRNYADFKATGKGKKGTINVDENAILCNIITKSDKVFPIRSCVRGKFLSVNPAILENPNLLRTKPLGEGHIAIVLPHKLDAGIRELKGRLLSEEDYKNEGKKSAEKITDENVV